MAPEAHAGIDLLTDLALIMCVAAVTTLVFQRLRQPVVLGYLLAGVLVGPHLPLPLFANEETAHTLSELGVILLMFSLGLEFRLRKLVKLVPTGGVVAVVECSLMVWLGYLAGRAFGWTGYESLFVGAAVAISSTTIIVKAFAENAQSISSGPSKGPAPPATSSHEPSSRSPTRALSELVFGILIVEDLIAILLMAVLTGVASGARVEAGALLLTVGRLAGFLVALMVGGMLIVPRLVRAVVRLHRNETTVVTAVGICFAFALLARSFGYSVALGAFLAGALVAESGAAKIVEQRVEPVRDVFAAVFFVSVGMLIDPAVVWQNLPAVLVLTVVVVVGKLVGVSIGAFVGGNGIRTSVQAGLSMGQIGEFSFIIAGVGLALGATRSFIYPVAVAVSAITTLLTPFAIRASGRVASAVDRRLPHAVQTYAALYGAWVQGLRSTRDHATAWSRIRRLVGLLLVDATVVAGLVIAASLSSRSAARWAERVLHLGHGITRVAIGAATLVLLAPFVLGAVRMSRALGAALAAEALPSPNGGGLDLADAPRRALLVTLQIAILLVAGAPLAAVTQPFIGGRGMAVLAGALLLLVIPFWRSAANLQGHVRAGAQVILEALATQSATTQVGLPIAALGAVPKTLPGLGNAQAVKIDPRAAVVGRTLRQVDLRGLTGATVIAVDRDSGDVVYPTADEVLRAGDALILTGTADAVNAARG